MAKISAPQIQASADKLLNLFNRHQFSFSPETIFQVYRRVARAIPMDTKFGGKEFASSGYYKIRAENDPRFVDRRMQALLRAIFKNIGNFNID